MKQDEEVVIAESLPIEDLDTCNRCGEPVFPDMPCTFCTGG